MRELTVSDKNLGKIISKINELIKFVKSMKPTDLSDIENRLGEVESKKFTITERYDDSKLLKIIEDQNRAINAIEKKLNAVKIPKIPKAETYDDKHLLEKINKVASRAEQAEKSIDYIRRTYSEKWELAEAARVKFEIDINKKIDALNGNADDIAELKDMVNSIFE